MKRWILLALMSTLLISGCADGIEPEPEVKSSAAAFSPDPNSHLPPSSATVSGGY